MRPIPQTVEVATRLGREDPEFDLLGHLQDLADAVEALVPDCIGLSIAWVDRGTAFTLEATDAEIAVLDAIQYLDGGPCVTVPEVDTGVTWHREDPLDEDIWRMFAQATAHCGVRSTLTMPLVFDGGVVGTANLYAGSDHAFDDHLEALARLLGGAAGDVVRNADLSFSTRAAAERAPAVLRDDDDVERAVELLVGTLGLDPPTAAEHLHQAAARADVAPVELARALILLLDDLDDLG